MKVLIIDNFVLERYTRYSILCSWYFEYCSGLFGPLLIGMRDTEIYVERGGFSSDAVVSMEAEKKMTAEQVIPTIHLGQVYIVYAA